MEKQLNRKGFAALLDGILAYTVAFACIGAVALLMTNTREASIKTSYTLNVWAEDLADAIGQSMVNPTNPPVSYATDWLDTTSPEIKAALVQSLTNIAADKRVSITAEIGATNLATIGNLSQASEVATATRLLRHAEVSTTTDPVSGVTTTTYTLNGDVSVLTVKIGI